MEINQHRNTNRSYFQTWSISGTILRGSFFYLPAVRKNLKTTESYGSWIHLQFGWINAVPCTQFRWLYLCLVCNTQVRAKTRRDQHPCCTLHLYIQKNHINQSLATSNNSATAVCPHFRACLGKPCGLGWICVQPNKALQKFPAFAQACHDMAYNFQRQSTFAMCANFSKKVYKTLQKTNITKGKDKLR